MPTVLTSVRRRRQLRSPRHFRCRMTLSWTFDYLSDLILVLQGLNHDVMDRNWNHNRRWGIYMTLWIWVGNDVNVLTAAGLTRIHMPYKQSRLGGDHSPAPPLPTKTNTTLVTIFAKKGVFFQWQVRIRESKKKGHFAGMSPRNFEKRVKFCMYLVSIVRFACSNSYAWIYLSFNHNLKVMKNVLSLTQIHIFSLSQETL